MNGIQAPPHFNRIDARHDFFFQAIYPAQSSNPVKPLPHYSDFCDEISREHASPAQTFDVGFGFAKNIIVSGISVARDESDALLLGALMPGYVDSYISKSLIESRHDIEGKTPRRIAGLSALVSHFNISVYGHWLLEGVPKLLLLAKHAKELSPSGIVLHNGTPRFVTEWINLVLPNVRIDLYDYNREYLVCDEVVFPSCLARNGYFFHPITNKLVDDLVQTHSNASASRLLYLTRESQSGFREMSNRIEIENIARDAGLELISPELLSISDQINLFANAKLIVGEFGSVMHNSIFSPPQTRVFCLNWIVNVQSRIAQLREQQVGYQLPSDGKALKYEHGIPGKRFYHIDPIRFKTNLDCLINSAT